MASLVGVPSGSEIATGLATSRIPTAGASESVGAVRGRLSGQVFDSVADVAVCDGDPLLGLVTIERLLSSGEDVLISDVMDDAPPWSHPGHRLPWLLLGLLGAMLASTIVSSYEQELSQEVILAFFIPGIVYMATPSAPRPRRW